MVSVQRLLAACVPTHQFMALYLDLNVTRQAPTLSTSDAYMVLTNGASRIEMHFKAVRAQLAVDDVQYVQVGQSDDVGIRKNVEASVALKSAQGLSMCYGALRHTK